MPCKLIFGLSFLFPLFHASITLLLSGILYDGLVITYTVLLALNKISHNLLGSKKSGRFCKHQTKKCHL